MPTWNGNPTDEQDENTTGSGESVDGSDDEKSNVNRRRLLQVAGTGIVGSAFVTGLSSASESPDRLEIVSHRNADIDYTFTSNGAVEHIEGNSFASSNPGEDVITEEDGIWTVDGFTADGYGDAFSLSGDVLSFEPAEGDYRLYLNGKRIFRDDLITEIEDETDDSADEPDDSAEDREHWYSFEATGDEYADYYFEVEDGGDMIPSLVDDAVIENDFHWISDDGTKAAGRVHPGDTHAYAFDTLVADVTIEGEAHPTVNGSDSNLYLYPQDSATGDHWKGHFPWHLEGEEREHWYSFEATGDEYADYYFEVEDGGDMIPSLVDDAVIEYEYFWISDDGTKAAGRVHPGDTHTYTFDTLVVDVTIEGEAHATVNGSDSNLYLYPQDSATGDHWKSGFPWQDDDEGVTSSGSGDGSVIGGGPGYEHTVTSDQADYLVSTRSELSSALSSASSGDVVFVDGNASIDMGSRSYTVPSGVTVASDRGVDGSTGAFISTNREPTELFDMRSGARFTGLQVQGARPGDDMSGDSLARALTISGDDVEVDNCDIWGFPLAGICVRGGDGHFHHNVIRECNRGGLGYGVVMYSGNPVIEYNYFNFNRHAIASDGSHYGYICRYNHFGPRLTSHRIDMHDPAGVRFEVHNNIVEGYHNEDGEIRSAVAVRGVPDDVALIEDNWLWNPLEPADEPDGWSTRQSIIQTGTSSWENVSFPSNYYGSDANTSFSDIIPDYEGERS